MAEIAPAHEGGIVRLEIAGAEHAILDGGAMLQHHPAVEHGWLAGADPAQCAAISDACSRAKAQS
jgi:hypothetical protein